MFQTSLEATFTENGVKHSFKPTDQPLPYANTVRRTRWLEHHINALLRNFRSDVEQFPFFKKITELFLRSDKIRTIIRYEITSITQEPMSMDGTTSSWTARVVKQVERYPQLFSVVRWTVTSNGLN